MNIFELDISHILPSFVWLVKQYAISATVDRIPHVLTKEKCMRNSILIIATLYWF